MKSTGRVLYRLWTFLKSKTRQFFRWVGSLSGSYPFGAFLFTLLVIFILIFIGNRLRRPRVAEEVSPAPRQVKTYTLGGVSSVHTQGQVEKSGVITIVAQTPGIVSAIRVKDGQTVAAKQQLFSLSNNYQGGSAAGVSRQIAQAQYKNVTDSYELSKELIGKQKEFAEKNRDNAQELRSITQASLEETRSLLSLNDDILNSINANLQTLEQNNAGGANEALILSTKQLKSQIQGAANQLRSGLRQNQYQADENKPPGELADLQKDIAVKQLELQQKSLDLSREVSGLQLRLAQISEAMMYPAAPFAGRIERIHVRVGQTVNPGTQLATLAGAVGDVRVVARVPKDVAGRISTVQQSIIRLPDKEIKLAPAFVAGEATDGTLVSVLFDLPADAASLTDTQFIPIELSVGPATASAIFFVPLDGIFQTQESSSVYVYDNGTVRSHSVSLGGVLGDMVEVTGGLSPTDEIVLDRNVLDGERVIRTSKPEQEEEKKRELGMK